MRKKSVEAEPVELPQEIWNVQQAMKYLKCGRTKLYELIDAGLPSRKIGNSRVFDTRDLAHWWAERKEPA